MLFWLHLPNEGYALPKVAQRRVLLLQAEYLIKKINNVGRYMLDKVFSLRPLEITSGVTSLHLEACVTSRVT